MMPARPTNRATIYRNAGKRPLVAFLADLDEQVEMFAANMTPDPLAAALLASIRLRLQAVAFLALADEQDGLIQPPPQRPTGSGRQP